MPPAWLTALTFVAALGCGIIGGVFFAFSVFVMRALGRLPSAHAIAAMQAINVTVLTPLFLAPFLGTGLVCAVLAVAAPRRWSEPDAPFLLAGGLLYLLGTFGVTMAGNVPLNHALARVDRTLPDAADRWRHYLRTWTTWNHVRTVAALAASAAFIAGLVAGAD